MKGKEGKMKYNFDLILTREQFKANRQKHLKQEKEKTEAKWMIIVLIIGILFLIHY